jgi:hypothetical protein
MAEEEEKPVFSERIKQLLAGRKWQTQELKLKRTKTPKVEVVDADGNAETVPNSTFHKRLIRKCEFPHTEAAAEMVEFLSSDECLAYLKFCRKELNETIGEDEDSEYEWVPAQAWFSEEDAANGHARRGMLYQVLKHKGDTGFGDGPYVTSDGCKYIEEYTFFWDVDEPPPVPESRSGEQYSLDIKRRDDADGMDGLYDCILVKRTTVQQDVFPYEAHMELGETQVVAQMLGVSDDSDLVDEEGKKGPSIADKLSAFAKDNGLKLDDGVVTEEVEKEGGKKETNVLHGMVVDITKEKNADCTTSITIRNTKEEQNLKSTVVAEVTARSIKTTTVNENVPAEEGEAEEAYPQVDVKDGVVTRKTVTKTKGGVRTIQVEETEGVPVANGQGTIICEQTLFEHQHTTIAEAQDEATVDAPEIPQTGDSEGSYERIQSTLRDDGKFDIQKTVTTELYVEDAVKHTTKTGTQFVEDTTDKSATSDAATHPTYDGALNDNQVQEVQATRTPAGRYDVRTITRTPIKKEATIEFRPVKRGRSISQETLYVFENYTADELKTTAKSYDGGSLRINEFGLYDGQFTTTEYSTSTDDNPEPSGDEYWEAVERQDVDVVSFNGGVYKRTTFWIEVDAYTSKSRKEIHKELSLAKEVSVAAADREQRHFNVKAESPRWYRYQSLTSSDDRTIGTVYEPKQFGKKEDSTPTT